MIIIDKAAASASRACSVRLGLLASAALALQACGPAKTAAPPAATLTPAQACLKSLDPASGVDACKAAIADSPQDAALRNRMGLLRLKARSLSAARQAYQIARSLDARDAEAQFGLGLTLEAIGEYGGHLQKLEAAKRDPGVIGRFRSYGIPEPDLLTFDTTPQIMSIPSPKTIKTLTPHQPLASGLGVDVRCLVSATGHLHACAVVTPLPPAQAAYGEAARKAVMLSQVKPARDRGKPVADAPLTLGIEFEPTT